MNVVIENDGKGKRHSFSASVEHHPVGPDWHTTFFATGYGATEGEARENLSLAITGIWKEATELIQQLATKADQ